MLKYFMLEYECLLVLIFSQCFIEYANADNATEALESKC